MEMQASRTLAVSQQQAWEALNDPEVLKLCIPGCDKFAPAGNNQYAVAMAVKIGPVSAKFAGKITLADIVPPESYTIAFDGSGGVAGFGKGTARVLLVPLPVDGAGQDSCELNYTVHASVGGKIAQLGQRLIDGAAKSMAEDSSGVLTTRCSAFTPAMTMRRTRCPRNTTNCTMHRAQRPVRTIPLEASRYGRGWSALRCWWC